MKFGIQNNDILESVREKIFQSFFHQTKRQGLGLGSAYDIVVKGHGGTLEVETKEGEGTEFILKLPSI